MDKISNLYKVLLNCEWLKNSGIVDACTYDFIIKPVRNETEAIKGIISIKWENVCLEERGSLTAYLACNHKEKYREWNDKVNFIKKEYLPSIICNIDLNMIEDQYKKEVLSDINFNVISIFMVHFYSDYFHSIFFNNLLKIYLAGQLPCGWEGKHPEGKIKVY